MSNRNSHINSSYDLGTDSIYNAYAGRQDVDQAFSLGGNTSYSYQCASCGNPPQYKLIAKKPHLQTADLDKLGYMCEHCVRNMSPEDYGLRKL